jgi:serine/threonine protein kinase
MGDVYKARDTRLDRIVALKIPKEQFNERFEREARAEAALNHPHICQLYDVGPDYLVMEYIDGQPVKGRLPIEQALKVAVQIAGALDAAHRKGVIHRDLKPANILVTKTGVKLLDFGLAKIGQPVAAFSAETVTLALTQQGAIIGTLQYMAPEQLQGREADHRSDIFAFGSVLYEILTGRPAFTGGDPASMIAAILREEPRPLSEVVQTAVPALDRTLKKCLAKDPANGGRPLPICATSCSGLRKTVPQSLRRHGGQNNPSWLGSLRQFSLYSPCPDGRGRVTRRHGLVGNSRYSHRTAMSSTVWVRPPPLQKSRPTAQP